MKWVAVALAMLGVIGIAMSAYDDSCVETPYSGGRLIECESMALFQPVHDDGRSGNTDVTPAGVASIALPPRLMALLGALLHGGCKATEVPGGQWTVCNDGFSLLERGRAPVAFALRLKPNGDPVAEAEREAAAARADIDHAVKDSDCGPFPCSSYMRDEDDPKRDAYLLTLSDYEIERLGGLLRAWEEQETVRALERARASNAPLQARLREIAEHEAKADRAKTVAERDERAETLTRAER
jgi:hypothetical protein